MLSLLESLQRALLESEESITDAKTFRDYAENKFKEVFGDEVDEKRMKMTIDGLIKQQEEDGLDWGEVVGMLNKSFGS